MAFLTKKTPEEKAAAKAEKQAHKAEARARMEERLAGLWAERDEAKAQELAKRLDRMKAELQPDETVEGEFRTAEAMMKKDLLFTSKRLLISPASGHIESIPYRAITSFRTVDFITRDLVLRVQDRRDELQLLFENDAERDRARDILNQHAI